MLKIVKRFQQVLYPIFCPSTLDLHQRLAPKSADPSLELEYRTQRRPPDLPLELWLEIFQFATYSHNNATIIPLDPFIPRHPTTNAMGANTPALTMRTKLALVLVSKAWRYVAIRMLYEHIIIRSPARAFAILKTLEDSQMSDGTSLQAAQYGQWTRHVEVYTFTRGAKDISYLDTIFKILKYCPNLQILSGHWTHKLPTEFFDAVARRLGPTLSSLYWNELDASFQYKNKTSANPRFLGSFQSLRVLDLRHIVGSEPSTWVEESHPTLPRLTHLILSTREESLAIATFLRLPSLRNLIMKPSVLGARPDNFVKAFLQTHGASLTFVDLRKPSKDGLSDSQLSRLGLSPSRYVPPDLFLDPQNCPNLEAFTFPAQSPEITISSPSLRRIGLRGAHMDTLYPDKPSSLREHLMSIDVKKFPRLESIIMTNFLVEAHTDSLIKDIFIWWVERFTEMGVDFLDGEGVLWVYTDPQKEKIED